jgi:polysaccharide deacetylase 2 family uncharacterized protein YibQ
VSATPDELTRPPGFDLRQVAPLRIRAARGLAVAGLAGAAGIIFYVTVLHAPEGGEPSAVAPIRIRPTAGPDSTPRQEAARGAEAAGPVELVNPRLAAAPDPRLIDRTRYGVLPRIGPDGAWPARVYARPAAPADGRPRVAILIGGLGIGQSATAEALAKLPPAVTLAFSPYGGDLERTASKARDEGHEIMLQVPMEPFDYPDNDPGPHTLTTRAKPQENLDRLSWVMGRLAGYTGIVTLMGAKLTADEAALAPVLKEVGSRGLVVLDDGSSTRSVLGSAVGLPAPTARAQAVLDTVASPDAIDRELQRLEDIARERGLGIGTATALPVTIERVARWAGSLDAKGIRLVPVSAAFETQVPR